jgi:hypothetical protein
MANNLAFTTAITVPNLQKCKILQVLQIDEDAASMLLQLQVLAGSGVLQRRDPWVLRITNGYVDALVANAAPIAITDVLITVALGGAGVAAAFTTALTAYRAAGGDKRGNLLTALQGISGVVQNPASEVGALSGTTVPVLPAGVVS